MEWFNAIVLEPLRSNNEPIKRLMKMSQSLNQFYNHGQNACILAILTFGESHDVFQVQVQQALNIWIDQLTQVLIEGGLSREEAHQRAEDGVMQIQGALVLTRGLNCTEPFERILQQLPDQLLKPA